MERPILNFFFFFPRDFLLLLMAETFTNICPVLEHHLFTADLFSCMQETSILLSLMQDIEPLDVSHISQDASADSMDAMKRTITGILGLMPSDQFQVTIEAFRKPLAKLLVSSMMTG
jgi:hypothetical protein